MGAQVAGVGSYKDYDWNPAPGTCRERVNCYPFVDSPSGDGQSVLSDPLDKYMTKEQLWHALVQWRRVPLRGSATKEMEVMEEEDGTIVTKRVMDLTKIKEGFSGLVRKADTTDPRRITTTAVDNESMLMTRSIFYGDGRSLAHNRDFVRVWSDPLVVEVWRTDLQTGQRQAHEILKNFMEDILNMVVTLKGDSMPDMEDTDMFGSDMSNLKVLCW
uniref:Uncharacterized protein n=1 Tax=Alexandrium catenella TaxID=2925 RepID=A0A7S1WPK2_ALECA|eukprot:CAMPEP_0171184118 /NCGR_PEP_ID=MMETSP0790-20130122/15626_1 /TAXON_ID=2925 /ORGANISM="Alexandrium catenella, Strain OF101" /LENGTH=215 /DNA_ID=CAMNT_0011649109 /DNA_START=48 /DNA_END=695 /DNA_ORIENTATION=-